MEHILTVLAVAMLVACLISIIVKSKNPAKYDERQKRVQAKAHKVSYYLLMILLVIYAIIDNFTKFCDTMTGVFICICISIAVYASICIFGDAYTAVNQSNKSLVLILAGGFNLLVGIGNLIDGELVEDGLLSVGSLNLAVGVMCTVIGIVALIRHLVVKNRYAAESEDE